MMFFYCKYYISLIFLYFNLISPLLRLPTRFALCWMTKRIGYVWTSNWRYRRLKLKLVWWKKNFCKVLTQWVNFACRNRIKGRKWIFLNLFLINLFFYYEFNWQKKEYWKMGMIYELKRKLLWYESG